MAFPAGVATRTVQVGPDILNNGSNVTGSVTISLYEQVIWTATHASILRSPRTYRLGAGGSVTFSLPNTSQAGFVDTAGNAVTGWLYRISYNLYGITEGDEPADMLFAVPAGGGTLYLNDLINTAPPADPVRVGIQPVLTVNSVGPDVTGNVVVAGGGGGGGASDLASITDMSTTAKSFNSNTLTTTAQMRNAIGIVDPSTFAASLLTDTTASGMLTTLGFSAFVKTLIDDADASAFFTTLGVSTFVKTVLDDADASAVLSTLGVSTFIKTLLDDASASAARTTLGSTTVGDAVFIAASTTAAQTALGGTSTGRSAFTATDAAALATAAGLGSVLANITTLQNQMNSRAVIVREISGVYTVPSDAGTVALRLFIGEDNPATAAPTQYDPDTRGDVWIGIELP